MPSALEHKLTVLPTWVAQQVADASVLLDGDPERAREHFRRLGVGFTVTQVHDAPTPVLRAVGTVDLEGLFARELDFPATGRSHPRAAP